MRTVNTKCVFVSDLHGSISRYETLFEVLADECPSAAFLGGDLFPHYLDRDFLGSYLIPMFARLRDEMQQHYPRVFIILGNDDPRCFEPQVATAEIQGLWMYAHNRNLDLGNIKLFGYSCVPPTPFRLKDWERYDVSRFCDPGCVSPEEGVRSIAADEGDVKWGTIESDLRRLANDEHLGSSVFLFHSPPYDTPLDRAALDGKTFEHVPLDLHIGSIAIRRFIEARQPLLTLHGHVHESARLTGRWKTQIGKTICISAAHDGPELALVRFDLAAPADAIRELL
jgi:Icc-related predicted phosphoesterase